MSKPFDDSGHVGAEPVGENLEELLLLISDEEKGFKSEAMDLILKMDLNTVYPPLESAVRNDDNADLRNGAMEVLVAFGKQVLPRLFELLADDNEEVRNFSAVMLGDIGNREAVTPLILALRDPDANVRHGAAEALGKIGDRGALAPLMELLQEDFWLQYPAIVALGEMRDKRAVPRLLELLDNEILMRPVIEALGKIGDRRVLYTLCSILGCHRDNAIAGMSARAIVAICSELDVFMYLDDACNHLQEVQLHLDIDGQGIEKLKQLLRQGDCKETVAAAITLLGWLKEAAALPDMLVLIEYDEYVETIESSILCMGRESVPYLCEALARPADNAKILAVRLIARLGDQDDLKILVPLLTDPCENVQREALAALDAANDEEMLPRLQEMVEFGGEDISYRASEVLGGYSSTLYQLFLQKLAAAPDPRTRKRAAILIGLGKADVPSDLLWLLARDECAAIRKQAIRALGLKKVTAAMGLLLEALTDPEEGVRIETVLSLAEFGEDAPLQELLNLLNDCSENLACAVVATIGRVGSDRAGRALLDYLRGRSVSRRVEFLIVETLGNLDFKPASELLKDTCLKHCDPDIRRLAVQALGNILHVHSLPAVAAACHDPHWSVRIAALHAVLKIGGGQALPILVAALSDPDYMVRKNAVVVLGESGNFLAIPHLVEQLDDPEMGRDAFDALIRFGRKGLTKLHYLLTAGYTDEIRLRLIDVIGKIGEKRSVKTLLGLLEDPAPAIRLAAVDALVFCFDGLLLKKLLHLKMFDPSAEVNVKADLALRTLTLEKFY